MKNSLKSTIFALILANSGLLVAMQQRPLTHSEMENTRATLQQHLRNLAWMLQNQSTDMVAMQSVYANATAIAQMARNFDLELVRQAQGLANRAQHKLYPQMSITGPGAGPARQLIFPSTTPSTPSTATAAAAATIAPTAPAPTAAPAPAASLPPATDMDID